MHWLIKQVEKNFQPHFLFVIIINSAIQLYIDKIEILFNDNSLILCYKI